MLTDGNLSLNDGVGLNGRAVEADLSFNDAADLNDRAVEADLNFNDAANLNANKGRRGRPESERLCRP